MANTKLSLLYSEFAILSCLYHGNSLSVLTEILAAWKSYCVATYTFDQEISCHPVQIVAETAMAAFILHFEIQVPRSRVHWQLS